MLLLDHLSESDRAQVLDKAALYLAQILAQQQKGEVVHKGQTAIAARLNCSVDTVAKLMAEQRLAYTRVGAKGYQCSEAQILEYKAAA